MWHIVKIFSFAWKYLRPYRTRMFLGILASFIYAASNGGFVWLTRAFTERFKAAPVSGIASVAVTNFTYARLAGASADSTVTNFTVTHYANTNFAVSNFLVARIAQTNDFPAVVTVTNYSVTNYPIASEKDAPAKAKLVVSSQLTETVDRWNASLKAAADPWLPRANEPITWRHIVTMILILPLLAVVRGGMDYSSNYCLNWSSARAIRDLRIDVMSKLASLSLDFFTRAKTGDLLTRINTDTQTIARTFATGAPDWFKESISLIVVFVVLWRMDWKLTITAMTILPLCAAPLFVLGKKARKATKAGREINVLQTSQLVEFISGIRVIKAFNLERAQIDRFRIKSAEYVHAGMKGVQSKESVGPIIEVISAFGLGALLLYVFFTHRDAGNLPAFVVGFLFFFNSVRKLAAVHILYEQAHISVDRLADIMAEQPKVSEPAQPKPITGFTSDITFSGVNFGYRDTPVLQDIELKVPRGFKLGIAGGSGSGKTTLVNLLFRFYDPTSGSIKVDGQDLRDLSVRELRQQMALVSQDIVLFDQSVAENIAQGRPDATRAEIEQAARSAFAHDFIMQLPQGYDTNVGERGTTLSGGQKQRVCIARAFIRNAPILVLDEATASLDSKSEAEVQTAIDKLAEHRTVVCIAHRLSTLAAMDQIIVLSEGRIVERGSFQELLRKGAAFAEMAAGQGIFPAANP